MKKRLTISLIAFFGILTSALLLTALGPSSAPAASAPAQVSPEEGTVHFEDMRASFDFNTDHFKAYLIEPQLAGFQVYVRGQFDNTFRSVNAVRFTRFLNPVDKNGEGIIDKNNHLDWYDLIVDQVDPTRKVTFNNQFGLQTIKIGQPVALLLPTEKIEPGSSFPQKLNHYLVYEVLSAQTLNKTVTLKDQFGQEGNVAIVARYFAVPVVKRHDAVYPIIYPDDHLVFYATEPKEWNVYRQTRDQFGIHDMKTRWTELLGVPTQKIAWSQ